MTKFNSTSFVYSQKMLFVEWETRTKFNNFYNFADKMGG